MHLKALMLTLMFVFANSAASAATVGGFEVDPAGASYQDQGLLTATGGTFSFLGNGVPDLLITTIMPGPSGTLTAFDLGPGTANGNVSATLLEAFSTPLGTGGSSITALFVNVPTSSALSIGLGSHFIAGIDDTNASGVLQEFMQSNTTLSVSPATLTVRAAMPTAVVIPLPSGGLLLASSLLGALLLSRRRFKL